MLELSNEVDLTKDKSYDKNSTAYNHDRRKLSLSFNKTILKNRLYSTCRREDKNADICHLKIHKYRLIVPYILYITMTCSILCHKTSKNQPTNIDNTNKLNIASSQSISTFSSVNDGNHLMRNLSFKKDTNPNNLDSSKLLNNMKTETIEKEPANIQEEDQQPAQMIIFDDDSLNKDDDDEEDEEEEEEEDFYNQNPVDSTKGNSLVNGDFGADIKVHNSDFKDFDDHQALRTSEFYPNNKTINNHKKRKRNKFNKVINKKPNRKSKQNSTNNKSDKYLRQESHDVNSYTNDNNNLSRQCAIILERGLCITYGMVEWAIRRARNILQFERADDLNSAEPSEATINSVGELNELTTKILASRFQLSWLEVAVELAHVDISLTSLWRLCPAIYRTLSTCLAQSRFRTHTGQCNNLLAPHLGSSYMPFLRSIPADYADGVGMPRRASHSGNELPPPRLLALYLHPDIEIPSSDLTSLFMSWGQLVNHDLAMASGARPATGHSVECCRRRDNRICMPIQVGLDDPVYAPFNVRCLDFKRSLAGLRPGCSLGPRIQLNTITSFIDASFVYGSRRTMTESLRRNERGLLNTWQYFQDNNLKPLLPPQTENPDEECVNRRGGRYCFLSGDARTNQQIQLAALHTYHTRQHNRLARALRVMNPHWSDNRLYHEARHIHIAIIQHILLNEYLPVLLGEKLIVKYNLKESEFGKYWDHYNPDINPSISQAFAAAAFRQGHTTVPSEVYRFNNLHELTRIYKLRQLFRQPWPLYEPGAMDEFLLGMLNAPAQSFDPFISVELSGHLLQEPGERVGLDLTAMNIQRGEFFFKFSFSFEFCYLYINRSSVEK